MFDVADSRLDAARRTGATAVASAAEAAQGADVIFGLVMSDDIPAAYLGDDGILAGAQPGASVLICSTTTRALVERVQATAPSAVVVLDAAIVGGVKYAERYRRVIDDYFRRKRETGQPSGELFS